MSFSPNSKIQHYFYIAILLAVFVLTLFIFKPFLTALVLAGVFAIILRPVHIWFRKYLKISDGWSSLLVTFLLIVIILVPIVWFSFRMVEQAGSFYNNLTESDGLAGITDKVVEYIETNLNITVSPEIKEAIDVRQYALSAFNWITSHAGSVVGSVAMFIANIILGLLIMFFILRDGTKFRKRLTELSPLPDEHDRKIFDTMRTSINSVIRGAIFVAVIQGGVASAGYVIFGLPNPIFWGGITALAALVPGIGTSLVMIPAVLYMLVSVSFPSAVGLAIWGAVAVGLIDNIVGPRLWGRDIKVPTILILVSVLGGIQLFGPIGFIIGPLVLSLLFALLDIYPVIAKSS
ncbi:MAG: AI-2E family transporter [Parcubacteria group bacterium]